MALDILETAEIIHTLENFIERRRPPENARHKIDIGYKIENQSVIIFEVRPHWQKNGEKIENPVAKTTWVKTQHLWKIYWMRADLKWHSYKPVAQVKTIEDFLNLVEADTHGCFWG